MSAFVQVKGVDGVRKMLAPYLEPELSKELDAGTKAAAQMLGKALKSELRPISRRMARAVRVKRARRERPAWVVGSRRKVAFFWPFVIGGTRDHGPRRANLLVFVTKNATVRTKRVRGVRPNPAVSRVASRLQEQVYREIEKPLPK